MLQELTVKPLQLKDDKESQPTALVLASLDMHWVVFCLTFQIFTKYIYYLYFTVVEQISESIFTARLYLVTTKYKSFFVRFFKSLN